jgi:hypothetical protein
MLCPPAALRYLHRAPLFGFSRLLPPTRAHATPHPTLHPQSPHHRSPVTHPSSLPSHPHPIQAFLTKFFTVDLPALITLPKRLEINIPPAVTAGEPPLQPVAVGHAAQAQDARLLRCA